MRKRLQLIASLLAAYAAIVGTAGPAQTASKATYYVSLGDSAAAGFQPHGPSSRGYADELHRRMKAKMPNLKLLKLGCPGESAETLQSGTGGPCRGPQLKKAVGSLRTHRGRVAFVTVNIGVNDVLEACLTGPAPAIDPLCVRREVPRVQARLASIIRTLKKAAPGVPIAGMSYWDPFLGLWTFPDLPGVGMGLAVINNRSMQHLNAGLAATYQDGGALFADVAGPEYFDIANFDRLVQTRWGTVPVNVARACTWTWFCPGTRFQGDPHPTTTGYRVVADAFEAVLRSSAHRRDQGG